MKKLIEIEHDLDYRRIGEILYTIRIKKKIEQNRVLKYLSINLEELNEIESGKTKLSLNKFYDNLFRLSNLYNINFELFFIPYNASIFKENSVLESFPKFQFILASNNILTCIRKLEYQSFLNSH